jgi:hypothetical protein
LPVACDTHGTSIPPPLTTGDREHRRHRRATPANAGTACALDVSMSLAVCLLIFLPLPPRFQHARNGAIDPSNETTTTTAPTNDTTGLARGCGCRYGAQVADHGTARATGEARVPSCPPWLLLAALSESLHYLISIFALALRARCADCRSRSDDESWCVLMTPLLPHGRVRTSCRHMSLAAT